MGRCQLREAADSPREVSRLHPRIGVSNSIRLAFQPVDWQPPSDSKITTANVDLVLETLMSGAGLNEAAKRAGIHSETLDAWRRRHGWFDDAIRHAIANKPGRVTQEVFDAFCASLGTAATIANAARTAGATAEGIAIWADRNGLGDRYRAAIDQAKEHRRALKNAAKRSRKLTGVERVNAALTDQAIASIAAEVRAGLGVEDAVKKIIGSNPGAFWSWRQAYPERAQQITDAVAVARGQAARDWTAGMCSPESQQAMLGAIEDGLGWNGVAKAAGTYAQKLKDWTNPPFISAEHERAVALIMDAWDRKRAASLTVDPRRGQRKRRDERMRATYGITLLEAEAMLARQGGRCVTCRTELRPIGEIQSPTGDARTKPVIDHCHQTGRVRGVLCSPCNSGIGMMQDDADVLERAAAYLRAGGSRSRYPSKSPQKTAVRETPKENQCSLAYLPRG